MMHALRRLFVVGMACLAPTASSADEPVVGGPCEGCELVFEGMPAELGTEARIASAAEPGEPLVIEGTVRTDAGVPVPGIILYAYHTDARGIYPEGSTRHGRLRAWVRTDAEGHYRFVTIRPASYPDSTVPQHVHMHVIEPDRCTYFIDSLVFLDDPHLEARGEGRRAPGGSGVVDPTRKDGVWHVQRDITLGRDVRDYPEPRERD